jgi:ribosome biogenesis ATPase
LFWADLSSSDGQVIVVGATNRPDSLDPALRRAGRFDREVSLGIPNEKARISILEVICAPLRLEMNLDLAELGKLTPGFVGADLSSLAREAAMAAVNR